MSEYRASRASVLQLWRESVPDANERAVDDLIRFNESIDQSLSKAIASYTRRVDQARDMFLAILIQDLRKLLSEIATSTRVLPMVSDDNSEVLKCGLRIVRRAFIMERMISDLLDLNQANPA